MGRLLGRLETLPLLALHFSAPRGLNTFSQHLTIFTRHFPNIGISLNSLALQNTFTQGAKWVFRLPWLSLVIRLGILRGFPTQPLIKRPKFRCRFRWHLSSSLQENSENRNRHVLRFQTCALRIHAIEHYVYLQSKLLSRIHTFVILYIKTSITPSSGSQYHTGIFQNTLWTPALV